MRKLMQFGYNHPWIVIFTLLAVCIFAAIQIPNLKQDPSMDGLMVADDPALLVYQNTRETFGSDQISLVFIRDRELFTPEKLGKLETLVRSLETLPGVTTVESLFSVKNFKNENGMLSSNPLIDSIPGSVEEARRIRDDALRNPLIAGNLVSKDGQATSINMFIKPEEKNPEFYRTLSESVDRLLKPLKGHFSVIEQLGNPYLRTHISDMMTLDLKNLIPLSVLVLLMVLIVTTRSVSGAGLPLITAGISVLLTGGFMSLTDIPINILTLIAPTMIIVIGSAEDVHLFSGYLEGVKHTGSKDLAIKFMISKLGTVVMLTALTTVLGFLSICINNIVILRQFGMAASFGLFVNPIVTCLIAPVYLRFFGPLKKVREESGHSRFFSRMADKVIYLTSTRKRTIIWIFVGVSIVGCAFAFNVRLDNNIVGLLQKNSPIVQRINEMSRDLPGAQTFFIRIKGGHEGLFKEPKNLEQIAAIQKFIKDSGKFDLSMSLVDILKLVHREMNGGDPGFYTVPPTAQKISQYLLFFEDQALERFVTPDFSELNILIRHNLNSSYEQKKAIAELTTFIESNLNPHFKYELTGESILVLNAVDSMANGQVLSISLLLLTIFVIMSILFLSTKAGFLALIPNVIPVIINFGIMGIFSIPLNVGTAMVADIAIGIAVDDTIHFMTQFNAEMRKTKDQDEALRICLRGELQPVFTTAVALCLGFAVLAFSNFSVISYFGILSAIVMIVAFPCDIFITPILLSSTRLLTLWDVLSLHLKKEVIEQSEFFKGMRMWQVKKIILLGQMRDVARGEHIYREGDTGDSMFLLLEGHVRRYGIHDDAQTEVAYNQFSPGDIFGHISMLDELPRSANTRAETDIKLVEFSRQSMDRLHSLYPHVASRIFRNIGRILADQLIVSNWVSREQNQ
jgi:predicted RND superfamily exporter protein